MDDVLKKIERLADLAAGQPLPLPLDPAGVMARIQGLEIEEPGARIPLGFFAGGAAAAAAAAVFVSILAFAAFQELASPDGAISSLMDVMGTMDVLP